MSEFLESPQKWSDNTIASALSPDGAWEQLVEHAQLLRDRPGKRWRARADVLLEAVPADVFRRELVGVIEGLPYPTVAGLHGLLVLVASIDPGEALLAALGAAAERCFRRVLGGARNQSAGTLCVKALAAHGGAGAAQLEAFLGRVVYPRVRERISLALDEIASGFGISRLELSELAVPNYGFDCHGARSIEVADGAAELHVTGCGVVDVVWEAPSGRRQKSPPAALRRAAPNEVREVAALGKEMRRMIGAQRVRIERSLSEERSWGYPAWRVRLHGASARRAGLQGFDLALAERRRPDTRNRVAGEARRRRWAVGRRARGWSCFALASA
jgi:hypothetical protein